MLNNILKIGKSLDWISPIAAIAQDLANGPSHTFLIPVSNGRTGREIINMLRRRGVKTWGHMVINDIITITVPESQVDWAQRLLDWAGVVTDGDPVELPQHPGTSRQRKKKAGRDQGSNNELRDIAEFRLW